MSEYQYYEFLAIDRPLSVADMAYVRTLSSCVEPTPSHAVFTYSWGDFRGDPLDLLAKHYDVMIYMANWGSRQFAFRFPKTAIDQASLQSYYFNVEEIERTTVGDYIILSIAFHEREASDWIEETSPIASFASLREDILRGDLRALYLSWLYSASLRSMNGYDDDYDEEEGDEIIEPAVPPGLNKLSAPLQELVHFFEIDQDLVVAAAQGSLPLADIDEPLQQWVELLNEKERSAFLVRAAHGEPIGTQLLRRLREIGKPQRSAVSTAPRRTFSAILDAAQDVRNQRKGWERQQAENARIAKLDKLAEREEQVWAAHSCFACITNCGWLPAIRCPPC